MIKVVRDNVLVRPLPSDEISEGGIIVPENMRKPSSKVEIVAVGPGTAKNPMQFIPGQIAFRTKDAGKDSELWENGVQYFILNQDWVLATLN